MVVPSLASPARPGQTDALARLDGAVVACVLWMRLTPALQGDWRAAAAAVPEAAVRHYLVHQASPLALAAAAESPFVSTALRTLASERAAEAPSEAAYDRFAALLAMPRDALLGVLAGGSAAGAETPTRLDVWAEVVALREVQSAVRVERALVRRFERMLRAPAAVVVWALLIVMFSLQLALSEAARAELWLPPSFGRPASFASYALVHSDSRHVLLNALALAGIGPVLERLLGPWRFLAAFVLAAVLAGLVSTTFKLALGWPVATMGASGAIAALGGFAIVLGVSFQRRFGRVPARYQWPVFGGALVWSANLFFGVGLATPGVDHAAHVGGLAAGVIAGFIVWPQLRRRAEDVPGGVRGA